MSPDNSFHDLMRRVRAGDQAATAEIVRQFEPEIRRSIRMRLASLRLKAVLDSQDVCQSVMANFFVRVAAGQFELETPEQLLKLLTTMARNRLLHHAERQQAGRRDQRRLHPDGHAALDGVADRSESPSQIVAGAELLRRARALLTEEERQLAEMRAAGDDWAAIARSLGGSPEALRKKLVRAMDRVTQKLGLEGAALPKENVTK